MVLAAADQFASRRTNVVIAHRLAGVADRIVVLDGGTNERTRNPRSSHLAVTSMGTADPAPHWFGRGTVPRNASKRPDEPDIAAGR